MNTELSIRILTKGERPELLDKINYLKETLKGLCVPFTISVSINPDVANPPLQHLDKKLTDLNVSYVTQSVFLDSVEEHMLEAYRSVSKSNPRSWIWLMDDSDLFEHEGFVKFVKFLFQTDKQFIFMNTGFINSNYSKSDPTVFALMGDESKVVDVILNSGPPHAISKLGATVIQSELLKSEFIEIWQTWLQKTVLFTHVYFYLLILSNFKDKDYFYNECILYSGIDPTNIDLNPKWIDWHKRTGKIFQQDWTFGQAYLLSYFLENKFLTLNQVRLMVISDSQRGVLPFYQDLLYRLITNQLPNALVRKQSRLGITESEFLFDFLKNFHLGHSTLLANAKTVISDARISNVSRLKAYKNVRFLYDKYCQDPWSIFMEHSLQCFFVFKRQTGYFGLHKSINPNYLFRDSSEWPHDNDFAFYSRDIQEIIRKANSSQRIYLTRRVPMQFFSVDEKNFKPFLLFPSLQIFSIKLVHSSNPVVKKLILKIWRSIKKFSGR